MLVANMNLDKPEEMNPKTFCGNMIWLIWAVLLVFGTNVRAQNLDSLELLLPKKDMTPEERMNIYYELCWGYFNFDYDKSREYAYLGLNLAKKEKNDLWQAKFNRMYSGVFFRLGDSDSALFYIDKSLALAQKCGDEMEEANVWSVKGTIYIARGKYPEALEFQINALKFYENSDDKSGILTVTANIALLYQYMEQLNHAEKYALKAKVLAEELDDKEKLIQINSCLSDIYVKTNRKEQAVKSMQKSIDLAHSFGSQLLLANTLQYAAHIYINVERYDLALKYAEESLESAKSVGSTDHIAAAYSVMARAQFGLGRYAESETAALQGFGTDSASVISSALLASVVEANIMTGNKKKALEYYNKYCDFIESRNVNELERQISEMEVKYETEKKELKISVLESEKQLLEKERRLTLWLSIAGGTALLSALAFFVVRQRLIRQKVVRLEREKQLIATQAVLDGETAERTRLARDLHDGLGGMLSVVKLNLNDMKNGVSIESEDVMRFDRVVGLLDESIRELRRVAHNMMPDSLTRYGLRVSLNDFCNDIPGAVFSHYGNDERLDPKLEVMIYRTVHELVNNVLKHAGADEIIVQMVQESDRVSIAVQDNGRGFDPDAETSGTGLKNIRNRVGSYNGRMEIYSEPGKGTEISVEFKLMTDDKK